MKPSPEKSSDKTTADVESSGSKIVREPEHTSNGESSMGELRRLLVGSEEISEVLPEAVSKSSQKDTQLSEATLPIVEENIRESVLRNPRILADALFPVIGPAIRKAISAALSSMVQSFNQTLEHSVSPKGLKWRFEAFRTGRSFGEVVMLKTLRYRVEQVFLIHRETGLLLEHVAQNPKDTEDADMVSAMLTAISDFAHDSFKTAEDATLDSFKISGLHVWIEGSPDAILAAAIRGNPPLELRETFSLAVEKIQYSFERELDSYDGESGAFTAARPALEECLRFQAADEEKKAGRFSPAHLILGTLGVLLLALGIYFGWDYWRWSGLLETVRNEPGYILTDYQRGWFKHSVAGLRDPLAGDSDELLSRNNYDEGDVVFSWREYQDSNPKFVLERAKKTLNPPPGVQLLFDRGVLTVEGAANPEWIADAKRFGPVIAGVSEVVISEKGVDSLISEVENSKILFECGTTKFSGDPGFGKFSDDLVRLSGYGEFELVITGFADRTGTPAINEAISTKRAGTVGAEIRKGLAEKAGSDKVKITEKGSKTTAEECKVAFTVNRQKK